MQKSKGCGSQGRTFCGLLQITWQLKTDQKHCLISALDLNVYVGHARNVKMVCKRVRGLELRAEHCRVSRPVGGHIAKFWSLRPETIITSSCFVFITKF